MMVKFTLRTSKTLGCTWISTLP